MKTCVCFCVAIFGIEALQFEPWQIEIFDYLDGIVFLPTVNQIISRPTICK
jgi:hypothetical protein